VSLGCCLAAGTLIRVTADDNAVEVELSFDWSDADGVEAKVASQFLTQIGMPAGNKPDGIVLVVGHLNPPIILGPSDEARHEQVARYGGKLPVQVHGRYVLSRARLEELRNALNELAEKYDELAEGGLS
jgi:hypothetical protein